MTRDERQALAIEKWKAVKCRGSWCFATGFGDPVGKREIPLCKINFIWLIDIFQNWLFLLQKMKYIYINI